MRVESETPDVYSESRRRGRWRWLTSRKDLMRRTSRKARGDIVLDARSAGPGDLRCGARRNWSFGKGRTSRAVVGKRRCRGNDDLVMDKSWRLVCYDCASRNDLFKDRVKNTRDVQLVVAAWSVVTSRRDAKSNVGSSREDLSSCRVGVARLVVVVVLGYEPGVDRR